ncbi:Imm1 family immunity protein [Streptomyces sp. RY43-2]|uniref:Imm1 family immunity protein n=1 Tax=Streptomyces macrolidinus TaxID=2952607 RepID=A0ABT0ZMV4_9ACTN|nr:Imm1 family immunity protein [Streptomyces macrolidinus]MCN9244919.1 Imm1 family immunity protein [Streptomyces macrolidinus]
MKGRAEAYYRKEHADGRVIVTPDDADALVDALLAGRDSENMAELHSLERPTLPSGFPDHEFLVGVDKELQVGVLSFMDESGNVVSLGTSGRRGGVSYFIAGNETEFPGYSEIAIDLVRRAVREFISSGRRPTCVQWQEPEVW